MKTHPISIGFDDARFDLKKGSKTTSLIGVICQGVRMVKVVKDQIEIDGKDSTKILINLVQREKDLVQLIFTHTITFGGFNLIDLKKIYSRTKKPIIAITERNVDLDSVKKALYKKYPKNYENKINKIINAGNLYQTSVDTAGGDRQVFFHCIGITPQKVGKVLEKVCIDSKLPESVRMAHLIGRAL
jgi:endonuclease V-like protein UPF0215 family